MKKIILIGLFSRIQFYLFAALAVYFIPLRFGYLGLQSYPQTPYIISVWSNFDGRHFLNIANFNYQNFNFVYFPLYPLIIRITSSIIKIPIIYIGILISLFFYCLAVSIFWKLAKFETKKLANLSLVLLLLFPTSFFYQSIYSDALFFFTAVGSIYYARKGNWIIAGVFGFLTTLTRLTGLAIIPTLFVEWMWETKPLTFSSFIKKCLPALTLSTLGILIYYFYLKTNYGNGLLFIRSFSAWHRDKITFPLQVIYRYLRIFVTVSVVKYEYWVAVLEFSTFCLFSYLTYIVGKYIRLSYAVWMFMILLFSTLSGSLIGMPRYALHMFPGFIALSFLLRKHKILLKITILIFLTLELLLTALFTRGYFVA